jgi:hypothetical protein
MRAFRQAIERPPIWSTSCATATLEMVAADVVVGDQKRRRDLAEHAPI